MDDTEITQKLVLLTEEHRDLDTAIELMASGATPYNQLQLQRLKKRKLVLKDKIGRFKALSVPDIIA